MIKVGINGYGTIGKRVADAVNQQDDMKIVGVTKTRPTFEARHAIEKGYDLYCATPEKTEDFKKADIKLSGNLEDLLGKVEVMVDCTPKKIGAENKAKYYLPKKINAVFQGGEKPEVADISFVAECNYEKALGKNYIRCVSCNTTGLSRVLYNLDKNFGVKKARVTLVRRSADPGDSKKGPINAIIPDPITVPSHHGPDVNTVLPDLDIVTIAFKVPTTIMHAHSLMVELKDKPSADKVIEVFRKAPRIHLVNTSDGIVSTAQIVEYARDMGRPRYDLYENCVWEDSIGLDRNELYFFQAIGQESIVVPENIDAIRAMFKLESDPKKSIEKTNKSLGI